MRKLHREARAHLLALLGPRPLFAVAFAADQTIVYASKKKGDDTTARPREARLFFSTADADAFVEEESRLDEERFQAILQSESTQPHEKKYVARELALPRTERYGRGYIERVDDPATWRRGENTW